MFEYILGTHENIYWVPVVGDLFTPIYRYIIWRTKS